VLGANDGTATANVTNPQGNITYLWNDPLSQTTQTATGLSAGTYTVIVTDDIIADPLCTATDSGTVEADVDPNAISGIQVWYDFGDATKINTGTPVLNDPIETLLDKSVNGFNGSQSTANFRPLWKTTYALFDGANDSIDCGTNFSKLPDRTVFFVFKIVTLNNKWPYGEANSLAQGVSSGLSLRERNFNSRFEPQYGDGTNTRITGSSTAPTVNLMLYNDRFVSSDGDPLLQIEVDGAAQTEVNISGSATSIGGTAYKFFLGKLGESFIGYSNIEMYDFAVWNRKLTDEENAQMTTYFNNKHSIF
ncbi:MAG: hypothetical protein KAR42_18195, partial [candidate division Zixibacteria bacterium]|nr:hypothetical protein [candidate division Zixibacteria bacterium]